MHLIFRASLFQSVLLEMFDLSLKVIVDFLQLRGELPQLTILRFSSRCACGQMIYQFLIIPNLLGRLFKFRPNLYAVFNLNF